MTNTVAVTGATGFLASHIIKQLLEQNYRVHGTVRSLANKSKYEFLLNFPNAQNLRLFEADLEREGSFDEVFADCEVVLHTASPFFFGEKDAKKELVDPAVNGTLNVLNSCLKSNKVRRVVITASAASIYDPSQVAKGKVFTEEDWNTASSLTQNPYWYSKVEAEKAAWDFTKKNNAHFDLIVLCPPFILGEVLSNVSSKDT
jgi:dihydroflavonol-4-reductase